MIALGCDHGGYELMQEVKKHLEERDLEYKDYGCNGPESEGERVYGLLRFHVSYDIQRDCKDFG